MEYRDVALYAEGKWPQDKPDWDGLPKWPTAIMQRKSINGGGTQMHVG